ncbi:MAG: lectin-like domain-containing protein, partial [Limisphaerales bacterium]
MDIANSPSDYITVDEYGPPQTLYNAGQINVSAGAGNTGVIYDAVTNYGSIAVTNGILSFMGPLDLANGSLDFGISDVNNYGSISLGNAGAKLSGTLAAMILSGTFVPATGDEWPVIAYGSVGGSFSKINLPPIADWEESADAKDYVITIGQTAPAPFFEQNLPRTNYAIVGGPAVMSVEMGGTPPFTNQWYYEAAGVTNALENGGRISGANTMSLSIANAQTNDGGPYQLFVTNGYAPYVDVSAVGQLVVEREPLFNGNGALWTLNGGASIQNNVLMLTDGRQDEASSAFYYVPMYYPAFRASFTYQSAAGTTSQKGDGITFCLQNTVAGTMAIGTGGGSLGYKGITNSLAIAIDQFTARGIEWITNGNDPQNPAHYTTTTPAVDPSSGDPINVSILFETNSIFLSLTDALTQGAFATNFTLNVPPISNTNLAFVGFTGSDGDLDSVQTISNFSFVPLPTISVSKSGLNLVLSWPAGIGGFQLQSSTNLLSGPWVTLPGPYNFAGSEYHSLTPSTSNTFYRLMLPPN